MLCGELEILNMLGFFDPTVPVIKDLLYVGNNNAVLCQILFYKCNIYL